jgi:hypothetical protein
MSFPNDASEGDLAVHIAGFFALATAVPHGAAAGCRPLDAGTLHARIEQVLREPDDHLKDIAVSDVGGYWRTVCKREGSGPASVVRDVAGLLRRPSNRWVVVRILYDVSENIGAARTAVRAALRDQIRLENRAFRAAPVVTNGRTLSTALTCIAEKIKTGRTDPRFCRDIPSWMDEEDE